MERRAVEILGLYGLSEKESNVYLFLLKNGPTSAGEIAKFLQVRRMEAYRVVKKLAESAVISASAGKPVKYTAQTIEELITNRMDSQAEKFREMEEAREELIALSKALPQMKVPEAEQKFRIIQGRERIYSQMMRMISASKATTEVVLTRNDLLQAYSFGITDRLAEAAKRGVKCRMVGFMDQNAVEVVSSLGGSCDFRHSDDANVARLLIADGSETLSSLVLDDSSGRKNERDIAIWSDSRGYAQMMLYLFSVAFSAATPAAQRMKVVSVSRRAEEMRRSVVDVIRATMPHDGWRVSAPGRIQGQSGHQYVFDVVLAGEDGTVAVDVVTGAKEQGDEAAIAAMMKRHEVGDARLFFILGSGVSEQVRKLARMLGVTVLDGSDSVAAVAQLRKLLRGG